MTLLDGVTVIENAQAGTGPFAASLLGDLGADVIKLERPGTGDMQRHLGTDVGHTMGGFGAFFVSLNRNKRYVTANLKSENGREVYRDLVENADVIIENFRPGKMDKLGIGYEDLTEINDGLIYCSINGFGRGYPYQDLQGTDNLMQAFSGAMSMTGEEDGKPVRSQVPYADIAGSMYTVQSALAGLYARDVNDQGSKFVEVSMDSALISWTWWRAWYSVVTGDPHPRGNRHYQLAPLNAYETEDSHILLRAGREHEWSRFCEAIGREDLIDDSRFESNDKRIENVEELDRIIEDELGDRPTREWFEKFQEYDVASAPVHDTIEVWDDPHVEEKDLRTQIPSEYGDDEFDMLRHPVKFDDDHPPIRETPRPVGADNETVLGQLGYSEEEIQALKEQNDI